MSTVGTASATASHSGEGEGSRQAVGDRDEDTLSNPDTNYREGGSVTSTGAEPDSMEEDLDGMANNSVGAYEDRMSDDGSASLVGFGEGANSTVSGPIYQRRVIPGAASQQAYSAVAWPPERTTSGLSDPRRDRDVTMTDGPALDPVQPGFPPQDEQPYLGSGPGPGPAITPRGPVPVSASAATIRQNRDVAERIIGQLDAGDSSVSGQP